MIGNFSYCNPTKLYFGEDSLQYLNEELPKYGTNVMLIYGGGSIKKNGIYDQVSPISFIYASIWSSPSKAICSSVLLLGSTFQTLTANLLNFASPYGQI